MYDLLSNVIVRRFKANAGFAAVVVGIYQAKYTAVFPDGALPDQIFQLVFIYRKGILLKSAVIGISCIYQPVYQPFAQLVLRDSDSNRIIFDHLKPFRVICKR